MTRVVNIPSWVNIFKWFVDCDLFVLFCITITLSWLLSPLVGFKKNLDTINMIVSEAHLKAILGVIKEKQEKKRVAVTLYFSSLPMPTSTSECNSQCRNIDLHVELE